MASEHCGPRARDAAFEFRDAHVARVVVQRGLEPLGDRFAQLRLQFAHERVRGEKREEAYSPTFRPASSRWAISFAKRWCSLRRASLRGSKWLRPRLLSAAWLPGRSDSSSWRAAGLHVCEGFDWH